MKILITLMLLAPLAGLLVGFSLSNEKEKAIFWTAVVGIAINMALLLVIGALWISNGFESVFVKGPVLYHAAESEFAISLFLDGYSLVYLLLSTFLTGIVLVFSRYYIHREKGYKRFFNNLKFFYFGLLIVLLSGNLETLFVGWEVLGVTSFFLIGFYRERYLPVKNALKVVSLYRLADIALLMGIWICHHYFGHGVNFSEIHGLNDPHPHILNEQFYMFIIPAVFLLAAMVKSAQFPFSSWLPRAMEGPTSSSAIFYGSLSVHIGVFLLIRTAPFWEDNMIMRIVIGSIGLTTCVVSTLISRVQSAVKTQIAYSSVAHIGFIFIELAFGLYWIAIIHVVLNALLRCHQLLVSPSVLSHRIHEQFFHFSAPKAQGTASFWDKLKLSLYVLGIKEFNLDKFMHDYLWNPLKRLGKMFNFISDRNMYILALPPFFMGLYAVYNQDLLPPVVLRFLPEVFAAFGLIFILKAFAERNSSSNAWVLIVVNQLYQSLAFGFNEEFDFGQIHLFLSGIFVSSLLGIWAINKLRSKGELTSLDKFHGHAYEHPRLAFVFVVACLGLAGFPITPTFIGEDVLLGHIHENQVPLLLLIGLSLILDGLAIFRIYSRLFLGQHKKGYHEVAYKSS